MAKIMIILLLTLSVQSTVQLEFEREKLKLVQARLEKIFKRENYVESYIPGDFTRAATLLYTSLGIWSCKSFNKVTISKKANLVKNKCYISNLCSTDRRFYHNCFDMKLHAQIEFCSYPKWTITIYVKSSPQSYVKLEMQPIKVTVEGNPNFGITSVSASSTFKFYSTSQHSTAIDKYKGEFNLDGYIRYNCLKPDDHKGTKLLLNMEAPGGKYSSMFTISVFKYHVKIWDNPTKQWIDNNCIACLKCDKICKWDIRIKEVIGTQSRTNCDAFVREYLSDNADQMHEIPHYHNKVSNHGYKDSRFPLFYEEDM